VTDSTLPNAAEAQVVDDCDEDTSASALQASRLVQSQQEYKPLFMKLLCPQEGHFATLQS